jgi:hypothetical protein
MPKGHFTAKDKIHKTVRDSAGFRGGGGGRFIQSR